MVKNVGKERAACFTIRSARLAILEKVQKGLELTDILAREMARQAKRGE
jgi:hypothetical protein